MSIHRNRSAADELANSLTHGFGLLLAVIGAPILILSAIASGDTTRIVAASIYASTLILLFAASTLYHSVKTPRAKEVWQRIDHSAIYLLIAGTYTPFTLITLRGAWGWTLFGIVWVLAVAGVTLKSAFGARLPALSTSIYLLMGWMIVIAARPMWLHVPKGGLLWLAFGGLLYTGGVGFYVWERIRYSHAVWHLFVLGGGAAHFVAVYFYTGPCSA